MFPIDKQCSLTSDTLLKAKPFFSHLNAIVYNLKTMLEEICVVRRLLPVQPSRYTIKQPKPPKK